MSDQTNRTDDQDMLDEYDFANGVRRKYYEQYRSGTNVVLLYPDVADVFHDSASVNEALRLLIKLAHQQVPASSR